MKATKAHFEQIPVETVKKIANELPGSDVIKNDDVATERQDEGTPQHEGWREMAQRVQVEDDPQRMMTLVEELITAIDKEEGRKSGKTVRSGACNLGPAADSTHCDLPSTPASWPRRSDLLE